MTFLKDRRENRKKKYDEEDEMLYLTFNTGSSNDPNYYYCLASRPVSENETYLLIYLRVETW